MREVYFHEDDFCQIEILPLSNLEFCLQQAGLIEKFSEEHTEGAGYNDIYIREENPHKLSDLNITADVVRNCFSSLLPEYEKIYTGYSSYKELCKNIIAFGRDNEETIFFQINDSDIVETIWCSDLLNEILQLPNNNELLLADWASDFICPLSESSRIKDFIKQSELDNIEFTKQYEENRKTVQNSTPVQVEKRWWEFWK